MENASKALIMAASVLIGVVISSLAVDLFSSFSGSANEIAGQIEEGQLQQFNNQFTSYEDKKDDLTIFSEHKTELSRLCENTIESDGLWSDWAVLSHENMAGQWNISKGFFFSI